MVKVADARAPELPREFLVQLDPKLAKLYSKLPAALAARIAVLARKGLPRGVHPNRILKFAYLYATAELRAQGEAVSKEHARRSRLELAGEINGLETGYRDEAEAQLRYRRGRRARQQIKASLDAVVRKWRVFCEVVEKHRSELPLHLRSRYSKAKLHDVQKIFQDMGIAMVLDEEDLARKKVLLKEGTAIAQTYIWWCLKMPAYYGKWNEMHRLAFAWRMSETESVRNFRTAVGRICKNASCTDSFGDLWDCALSDACANGRARRPEHRVSQSPSLGGHYGWLGHSAAQIIYIG